MTWFAVVVAAICLGATPATAQDRPPAPGELGTLLVPGGRWALSELGIPATLERGSVPRILVQRLWDPAANVRPSELVVARVQAGLDLAVRVEDAARAVAPGGAIAFASIKTRQSRERAKDAMDAVGAELKERRGQYSATLRTGRRERDIHTSLKAMGFDVADAVARLNKGETVTFDVPADGWPLPLTTTTWGQVAFERPVPPRALFAEMFRTPNALLFWYGLMAVDASTRRFLEASPDLIKTLVRDAAPTFAAFSAQVLVREGRVQIAGGEAVQLLWESLVDERASSPVPFVRRLFTRDEGRLAVFFDLIQRLPEPRRRFATGLWMPNVDDRLTRFRALYAAVASVDPDWQPAIAPFKRTMADPWILLRAVRTSGAGGNGLAGPQARRFWERAFDGNVPEDPARALRDVDEDGLVDAAWLVEQVCLRSPFERTTRMRQLSVVTHAFEAVTRQEQPGALVAAHGLARFPALFLVLERAELLSPAVAVAAFRAADEADRIGDRDRRALALASLHGGVALVDRLVFARAIDAAVARQLVSQLLALPLRDGAYGSGVAEWLTDRVMPALGESRDETGDARVVSALARRSGRPSVEWEGERYVVDWAAADRDRLTEIRTAQAGFTVDDVVRLVHLARQLAKATTTPEAMREPMREAGTLATALERHKPLSEIAEPVEVSRLLAQVQRELERVRSARDRDHVARAVERIARVADWATAHVLAALAYLPHLGDPAGAAARAGDLHLRHRFGVHDSSEMARRDDPWRLPTEIDAGGGVTGALVGLDIALARLSLRRLSTGTPPAPTLLSTPNAEVVAATAALSRPQSAGGGFGALAQAIARGRSRVRDGASQPQALDAIAADIGLSGDRRSALSWMALHEPEHVLGMFSLDELLLAGGTDTVVPDALGTPAFPLDARLRLAWAGHDAWEAHAGRQTAGLMAVFAPDVTLRLAELLAEASLPAELLPGVQAYALQDLLDAAPMLATADWLGFVRFASRLTLERFEDYVSALAGIGVLVPTEGQW